MPKVLIIEDDPDIQDLIAHSLLRRGVECVTASDGLDGLFEYHRALYKYRHDPTKPEMFGAIVLDCALPGVSGFTVGQNIRNMEKHHDHVPPVCIIAFTAYNDRLDGDTLASIKPDRYIPKPGDRDELLDAVLGALGLPATAKQLESDNALAKG